MGAQADHSDAPPAHGLFVWLPGLWVLRHYRREWLLKDLSAGLVLTAVLVPTGMGYAEAAGLPAVTGLYATIIPLLAYAVFGPSRTLVLGPDSGLAALISVSVVTMAAGNAERAVSLASVLALLTGTFCIVAGLLKVGFVTELLSKPVRVGYLMGIALTVLVSQLPKLCGYSVKSATLIEGVVGFAQAVAHDPLNGLALALGVSSLVLMLVMRRWAPKWPGIFIAVVLSSVAVAVFGLVNSVDVVGAVPRGVPLPALPNVAWADLSPLLLAAVGIALVSFTDMSVLSRTYAGRSGLRVDANRELIGLGVANVAAGFFRGFPISSSASRTPVAESAGSKTQVTGIVGAVAITVLLVVAPNVTRFTPTAALAAVVVAAILRSFDLNAVATFYRVRRSDFVLTLIAFLGVALLGVISGIALAVGVSMFDVVRRAWRPHDAVLGRVKGLKGYHDVARYPDAQQVPGLLLLRWDAPLFFANADTFRQRLLDAVEAAPTTWVVIAAEPITDVDTTAAEMLQELDTELAARGAKLAFAELKDPVKDLLQRYGLHGRIGTDFFFPTIGVAVKTYLERNAVTWVDWEEK